MTDILSRAREMLRLLEAGDVDAAMQRVSERIRGYLERGWTLDAHLRDRWRPGLDDLAGSPRAITDEAQVSPTSVRFTMTGDRGRACVTISFDDDGGVGGFAVDRDVFDGIANLVITCPDDRVSELATFYGALLGVDRWRRPTLVFDEGRDYRAPVWSDPDRPQQLHTDIRVRDLAEAEAIVLRSGAERLRDGDDHVTFADPIGHAFCLYPDDALTGGVGELWRVVFDSPNPRELATFYEVLLGMTRIEDSPTNVVIASDDGRRPMLGFQQGSPYIPPRWPDPAHPAQMHFDVKFDDAPGPSAPRSGSAPSGCRPVGAVRSTPIQWDIRSACACTGNETPVSVDGDASRSRRRGPAVLSRATRRRARRAVASS